MGLVLIGRIDLDHRAGLERDPIYVETETIIRPDHAGEAELTGKIVRDLRVGLEQAQTDLDRKADLGQDPIELDKR